jgi:hypothetical protein
LSLPSASHSAKCYTRQRLLGGEWHTAPCPLPSAGSLALGKVITLPSAKPRHSAKYIFFWFLATKFFVKLYYSTINHMLKFGTLSLLFGIFL